MGKMSKQLKWEPGISLHPPSSPLQPGLFSWGPQRPEIVRTTWDVCEHMHACVRVLLTSPDAQRGLRTQKRLRTTVSTTLVTYFSRLCLMLSESPRCPLERRSLGLLAVSSFFYFKKVLLSSTPTRAAHSCCHPQTHQSLAKGKNVCGSWLGSSGFGDVP